MERGTGGGQQQQHQQQPHHQPPPHHQQQQQPYYQHTHHTFMTTSEEHTTSKSSFDNPATKKKPPKLKAINRSLSMAIDNYEGAVGGGLGMGGLDDASLIVEPAIIHRSASPVAVRSAPPPQTLALPSSLHPHASGSGGGGGSGAVSPALSARQYQQQQHLHTFQHMAAQARQFSQQQSHASSTSSPISHTVSPVLGSGSRGERDSYHHHQQQQLHQPDIFLVSSSSLAENVAGSARGVGGSTSPIQFIDDYMLPPTTHRQLQQQQQQHAATHPFKKSQFRRSDTIDVHPASTFQMKKTHSFHAPPDAETIMDPLLLSAMGQPNSASSSRRTSSVRGNFLMPGHASAKDISRSPSPSRRGARSHRSLHDPSRRPSAKPESVVDSQIRHPSLNDDLLEPLDGRSNLLAPTNLSLDNELFVESRSRSNSHTKMEDVGLTERGTIRKTSSSFEDATQGMVTHVPANTTSSLKKRADHHAHSSRQHSSHSLELDGRPSTSAAAAAAATHSSLHLHTAAAAATAAYHFKRGTKHGRSLYLSPNNLEEVQVHHRPAVMAAAAAFGGTNASAASIKQAKALHSASMRLRTYRETLSATKKSKSFIGDSAYPPPVSVSNEFVELTSPHRRNSGRALASSTTSGGAATIEDIKRSPRPVSLSATAMAVAATTAFMEDKEKRPSFERKPSLTYEIGDAAFEQVLRPFHHKATTGLGTRKSSLATSHKALKKKSLSDETDEDEEADRKRKRIVCIVMTVFLCLVCAAVFVVIMTLTHSSTQSHPHSHHHHLTTKKTFTYNRDVPVHYNVRQENERLMKETMDRARFGKNFTETASSLLAATTSTLAAAAAAGGAHQQQQQLQPHQQQHNQQQILLPQPQQYPLPHLQQIP
ncbi:uncharacterized protein LOC135960733 isoform X2 [Calliphora vicina]|uniref:uncharacterized protein LOC135960733 isoform X2 n=1 Tax=Calliphora vicina TaxID=7373 RepID=UPI00325B1506